MNTRVSTKSILVAIGVLAGVTLLVTHLHYQRPASLEPSADRAPMPTSSGSEPSSHEAIGAMETAQPGAESVPDADSPGFAAKFRSAEDYGAFMDQALRAAERGDGDAAYFLATAIAYCEEMRRFYFQKHGVPLSVDDAIAEKARLPERSHVEAIRRADGRCRTVYQTRNAPWGSFDRWIAMATDAGQPNAQVRTAQEALVSIYGRGTAGAPRLGKPDEILDVEDARRLARLAMETKDPDALFEVADLQGMLNRQKSEDQLVRDTLTYKYTACLRGAYCDRDAEWVLFYCRYSLACQGNETGTEYLRNVAASIQFFDVDTQAMAVSARIDTEPDQVWRDLGLVSPAGGLE